MTSPTHTAAPSRSYRRFVFTGLALATAGVLAVCNRTPAVNPSPTASAAPSSEPAPTSAPVASASATPSAAPAVEPTGPSAELTGEHYALTVALSAPSAVPGESSLTVELHGTDGFHMNELYPHALRLSATNATAPEQVRRAEATEVTQQRAAFRVPVQVTAAGAVVRGTARFAVCSAENCVPMTRDFAVALR